MRIILASNSPRRKELLHQIFEKFEIIKSNFDESTIKEKEPKKLVQILSLKKAEEVFEKIKKESEEILLIGGDTLVYFNNEILGKPKDKEDAFNTLKKLQGNKNKVYSAFTIILKKNNKITKETHLTKNTVTMKAMSDEEIEQYIKTGEPMDKAGSYAVQGIGSKFIEKVDGSYNAVVGLDIEKLKETIRGTVPLLLKDKRGLS